MKRKIVQFRYFQDGRDKNYVELDREKDFNLIESFHKENKLYKLNDGGVYISVPSDQKLEEKAKYFYYATQQINYPITLYSGNLVSGSAFANCVPIVKLGIQSLPGVRFRFNSNLEWIMLGATGLYELDLKDSAGSITDLKFDKQSISIIDQNPNAYLIIDIVYEEEDS